MGLASSKAVNSIASGGGGGGTGGSDVGSGLSGGMILGNGRGHGGKDGVIVDAGTYPDIRQPCSILPSPSGSSSIDTWKSSCHVRQASIRSRNLQPMPDTGELDRRFAKVLVSKRLRYTIRAIIDIWLLCDSSQRRREMENIS